MTTLSSDSQKLSEADELEVREDPALSPCEKGVGITALKDENEARIHSEVGSVSRALLKHPHATVEDTREIDGTIVAVKATIPIGLLSLGSKPRNSNNWSQVVKGGGRDG